MKLRNTLKYFMAAAVISMVFISCRKEKDNDEDKETTSARDNALAEGTYNDVANIADQASVSSTLSTYSAPDNSDPTKEFSSTLISSCATITRDTIAIPHTIIINFGTSNCLCNDGRNRRGIINVSYNGHYRDSASTHTITFTDYYVNDNKVSGTKTVVNNGHNSAGNLTYSITVNGQIDRPASGATPARTITWTSNRTREWIVGENTAVWGDDVYLITGTANGVSAPLGGTATSFTITITSALRREIGCRHFVSGKFDLTPSGKATRHVDFGTGACDNDATVTINGHLYNVSLN
jgi:hypothetical protein